MKATALSETERLAELRRLGILDSPPDRDFDIVSRAAAALLDVPIALVSLVDESRQWFKSAHGLELRETPRNVSFCSHAITRPNDVMVVRDARADERFARTALVTAAPHIRFYAGAPMVTQSGHAIGTVCAIDRRPRSVSADDQLALRRLADFATRLMELSTTARGSKSPYGSWLR